MEVLHHTHEDFIERNGTWLLSMVGVVSACMGTIFAYFLRSRCRTIRCWGVVCEREPIPVAEVERL
jgi:hypothetical protein